MKTTINSTRYANLFPALKSAIIAVVFLFAANAVSAQTTVATAGNHEEYGHTYNIGLGPGYFGSYLMRSPYFTFNYEIEALPDFTLAPFVGFATSRSNPQTYRNQRYYYRSTIIPIGVKATYYFDDMIELPWRWDLYAAGSLGYTFISKRWDSEYGGPVGDVPGLRPLFLDVHLGAEYHINDNTGIFLDLSTGVSVIGIALHR